MDTLYILIRTSNRPEGFKNLIASIRQLEWDNIKIVVHTDDPRDDYVEGDIIIKGEVQGPYMGTAPYNLYNNRLLHAIKEPGWIHFIDDDDKYSGPDVFNKLLDGVPKDKVAVGKVIRWEGKIFPAKWKQQRSFQTECFSVYSDIAKKYKWWADKGGDHYYSRQIVRQHGLIWKDVIIAEVQNEVHGKGHGRRIDVDNQDGVRGGRIFDPKEDVYIKLFDRHMRGEAATLQQVKYEEAVMLERLGYGRLSYKGTTICMQ